MSTTLTEVREENMMRQRARILALFLLVTIGAASQYAQAANVSVNCDKHDSIRKALHLVAISNSKGPSTITVSGACEDQSARAEHDHCFGQLRRKLRD